MDANVPMYLMGADEALAGKVRRILRELAATDEKLVTDAEVFQEILHRYIAIRRRHFIQLTFDALQGVVEEVFPIEAADVFQAKDVAANFERLSARDALHVAIMRRHGVSQVLSFDRGFDAVSGIQRIPA